MRYTIKEGGKEYMTKEWTEDQIQVIQAMANGCNLSFLFEPENHRVLIHRPRSSYPNIYSTYSSVWNYLIGYAQALNDINRKAEA